MKATLITLNVFVLAVLAAATYSWPPAGFLFLFVGPLSILALQSLFEGGPSIRAIFVSTVCAAFLGLLALSYFWPVSALGFVAVGPIVAVGIADMLQREHALRRNFPVLAHARYLMEMVRPEIQQYFVESNDEGRPFPREDRSVVYQRAKGELDTLPFGTQRDVYRVGYEWINHSLAPVAPDEGASRIRIGEATCEKPYEASILNVSAMSFGALSGNAVAALNRAAKAGRFAHNTGEGGISRHHRQGGDLIWQIGTGYFGCRTADGRFDAELFRERAQEECVRMIEVKLSQGAKPGHGGILPASKVSPEIAEIRCVPPGRDVISPPAHSAFSTPVGLLEFVARLRELSGGKPVGFKLCVGKRREFLAICKAMLQTGLHPDYIAVDGGEGGTGAAPFEFSNSLGCPLSEGLVFVHNALAGVDLRERVRVFASGKVSSGFGMTKLLALGADACYSARAMMMALGCIQARRCNTNECPVGVASQNPALTVGLVVEDKAQRVARYHQETVEAALELMGAAGIRSPRDLRPWHIMRRISPTETAHYGEIFEYLAPGALLREPCPPSFVRAWSAARAKDFRHASSE